MAINPAMLALSAANPGLLPLALGGYGTRSAYIGGTVRHTHSGSVEHSFKPGSGEELRGIAVDNRRAVAAYQKALAEYDAFVEANRAVITAMDDAAERRSDEHHAEFLRRRDEREAKRTEYHARQARHRTLEKADRSFWGLSSAEKRELDELRALSLAADPYCALLDLKEMMGEREYLSRPGFKAKVERREIAEKLGIASVASNMLYLSRAEVLEIHAIETGEWLQTTKLAQVLKSEAGDAALAA